MNLKFYITVALPWNITVEWLRWVEGSFILAYKAEKLELLKWTMEKLQFRTVAYEFVIAMYDKKWRASDW